MTKRQTPIGPWLYVDGRTWEITEDTNGLTMLRALGGPVTAEDKANLHRLLEKFGIKEWTAA